MALHVVHRLENRSERSKQVVCIYYVYDLEYRFEHTFGAIVLIGASAGGDGGDVVFMRSHEPHVFSNSCRKGPTIHFDIHTHITWDYFFKSSLSCKLSQDGVYTILIYHSFHFIRSRRKKNMFPLIKSRE